MKQTKAHAEASMLNQSKNKAPVLLAASVIYLIFFKQFFFLV